MNPDTPNRPVLSSSGQSVPSIAPLLQHSTTSTSGPLPAIPDHQLLGCIGRGSYGEVWLGQNVLGSLRAIKIVWRKTFWHDHPFEREFNGIQKFEPISRSHQGLVDVLQIGRGEGYFYYVMELADNSNAERGVQNAEFTMAQPAPTLSRPTGEGGREGTDNGYTPRTLSSEIVRRGRLPVSQCIEIGLRLTSALAHLHKHKLVHRDVKPANIIFVGGAPKLADIGLVAEVSEARSYVGTEGYIPPEGPGTVQADIYSLGKLLYEISTGKDRHAFPELPNDLHQQSEVKELVELNAILLKACQPHPRHRYASADSMHREIAQLHAGQSIQRKHAMQQRLSLLGKIGIGLAVFVLLLGSATILSKSFLSRGLLTERTAPEKPLTTNIDALNAYAQGRHFHDRNTDSDQTNAVFCFARAVAFDPNFAEAYAGLASTYTWMSFPDNLTKARVPAEKALALNPNLAEAHKTLAILKYLLDWQWAEAEQEFQRALQLEPHNGDTSRAYGFYLKNMGRTNEAINMLLRARELDSSSISVTIILGHAFFAARDYDQAIKQYQTWLSM